MGGEEEERREREERGGKEEEERRGRGKGERGEEGKAYMSFHLNK